MKKILKEIIITFPLKQVKIMKYYQIANRCKISRGIILYKKEYFSDNSIKKLNYRGRELRHML